MKRSELEFSIEDIANDMMGESIFSSVEGWSGIDTEGVEDIVEDNLSDYTHYAVEAEKTVGEVSALEMTQKYAERFVYSQSTEAEGDNIFKRAWDGFIAILKKIWLGMVKIFKSVGIWIAGDLKKYKKFYEENSEKIKGVEQSDVTVGKVLVPKGGWMVFSGLESGVNTFIRVKIDPIIKAMSSEDFSEATMQAAEKADEYKEVKSMKDFRNLFYGEEKPTPKEMKASEFFSAMKADVVKILKDANEVKKIQAAAKVAIQKADLAIKGAKKISSKSNTLTDDQKKKAKKLASMLQSANSNLSTTLLFAVSAIIRIIKVTKAYCEKYIAANKANKKGENADNE
jgi:hypothetical protein